MSPHIPCWSSTCTGSYRIHDIAAANTDAIKLRCIQCSHYTTYRRVSA